MWNLEPPPGFQGLRDDLPLKVYVRHLPHWRQEGATYFVTFRLCDSLPQSKLHELDRLRADWARHNPMPRSSETFENLCRVLSERVERWLDEGMGTCVLKQPELATFVTQPMHHFDLSRYELVGTAVARFCSLRKVPIVMCFGLLRGGDLNKRRAPG
jgi:putative transposase